MLARTRTRARLGTAAAAETARYLVYRAGWRHAPRLLRRAERLAHGLRDRALVHRSLELRTQGTTELTVGVIGWDAGFAADVRRMLPTSADSEIHTRQLGSVRAHVARPEWAGRAMADVAIVELPEWRVRPFAEDGWLVLPKRVGHLEELDREEPAVTHELRRAVEREGLTFDASRSAADLAEFHRDLYLPMLLRRHGDRARATPLALLTLVLREGWLLRVLERGRWVSAALVAWHPLRPRTLSIVVLGVRDGDYGAVSEAARLAPVLFARDLARREGAVTCDHLVTRPFPLDGLFRRKRRWLTTVVDLPERADRVALRVLRDTAAVRRWLGSCPFIALGARGLVGIAWGDVTAAAIRALDVPGLVARHVSSGVAPDADEGLTHLETRAEALTHLARELHTS